MKYNIRINDILGGERCSTISEEEYESLEQILPFGRENLWFSVTDINGEILNYNRRHVISVILFTTGEH